MHPDFAAAFLRGVTQGVLALLPVLLIAFGIVVAFRLVTWGWHKRARR